jgi:hypothetical protein
MQKLNREPSRFRDKSRALLVTSSAEKIEWQKVTTLSPSPTCSRESDKNGGLRAGGGRGGRRQVVVGRGWWWRLAELLFLGYLGSRLLCELPLPAPQREVHGRRPARRRRRVVGGKAKRRWRRRPGGGGQPVGGVGGGGSHHSG